VWYFVGLRCANLAQIPDKIGAMIDILKTQLTDYPDLELLVLIGSRARGAATAQSDWDFALRWVDDGASFMDNLAGAALVGSDPHNFMI
jgi:predicted nucleotidyltransferase